VGSMRELDEMIAVMQAAKTKVIRARRMYGNSKFGDWFTPCNPQWDWSTHDYEVVPEPKRVPLGPEDVPPGSALRSRVWSPGNWSGVLSVSNCGVLIEGGHEKARLVGFLEAMGAWEISRDGGKTWQPCWKEEA
jgi:hypothetical protein